MPSTRSGGGSVGDRSAGGAGGDRAAGAASNRVRAEPARATGPAEVEPTASEAAMSRAALAAEAGMPLAEAPEDSTERARAPIAAAAPPAWDLEAAVAARGGGGRRR